MQVSISYFEENFPLWAIKYYVLWDRILVHTLQEIMGPVERSL